MSEASGREETPGRPGPGASAPDPAGAPAPPPGGTGPSTVPGTAADQAGGTTGGTGDSTVGQTAERSAGHVEAAGGGRGGRGFFGLGRRRRSGQDGPAHGGTPAEPNGHRPTGLAASMVTSGGLLLAMVEDLRMRGGTRPEDVRPLADTFARHCAAKEATVRKVLERHGESERVVMRDRQEGDLIQGILDRALTGRHPEDTRRLTIDGALTQMYQYLFHERRDLVPALERAVPFDESETLSAAFEAINHG
jgi:hypothetical protein